MGKEVIVPNQRESEKIGEREGGMLNERRSRVSDRLRHSYVVLLFDMPILRSLSPREWPVLLASASSLSIYDLTSPLCIVLYT